MDLLDYVEAEAKACADAQSFGDLSDAAKLLNQICKP